MSLQMPDKGYWNRKLAAYFHDPLDKVMDIRNHEKNATEWLKWIGLTDSEINAVNFKPADHIAAGSERARVLGYNWDPAKSGAVDFNYSPVITHPIGRQAHLNIDGSGGESRWSGFFKDSPETREMMADPYKKFCAMHLALRHRLGEGAALGAFWHRIPADTRFPDHSIWNHNALTSALYSCAELSNNDYGDIGLMVVSLGPVQTFIEKARKLRDYWTGSVLLSWLAFEGIRWVMEYLGPDHIIYPSLVGQPLVNQYLAQEKMLGIDNAPKNRGEQSRIASFPNKFVALVPYKLAAEYGAAIGDAIKGKWLELVKQVESETLGLVPGMSDDEKENIKALFQRQNENYWEVRWAASRLITAAKDADGSMELPAEMKNLLDGDTFERLRKLGGAFKAKKASSAGICYGATHGLAQSALAAAKSRRVESRPEEPGKKCMQCGELEALHARPYDGKMSAREYAEDMKRLWTDLAGAWKTGRKKAFDLDDKGGEALCSVCLTKRLVYCLLPDGHILERTYSRGVGFPSTTEMALYEFFRRNEIKSPDKQEELAQRLHDNESEEAAPSDFKDYGKKLKPQDRYYAILLMDGDKMGDLVNGATLAATWESILHPEYHSKLMNADFPEDETAKWNMIFNDKNLGKRSVTPAIHAAISEALGDFSVYCVPEIIKKYDGKLVYAGGDDVCAVLPMAKALKAAREIREAYHRDYYLVNKDGTTEPITDKTWKPKPGRLAVGLGKGDGISISAAVLVCHHKEPLQGMLRRAHELLTQEAKAKAGRNALALELRKRSGGSRTLARKWDSAAWAAFDTVLEKAGNTLSASKVYQMEQYRDGLNAILSMESGDRKNTLVTFVKKELEHSGVGNKDDRGELAKAFADIMIPDKTPAGGSLYETDGLVIAAFMGGEDNE